MPNGRMRYAVTKLMQDPGKMRTIPSKAGPVDAGPTVLTMKSPYRLILARVGEDIAAQRNLEPLIILPARLGRRSP
jgi:hypothetical protein